MTKRNDNHAPSTFDPAAYTYQGTVDLKPPMPPLVADECAVGFYEMVFKEWREERAALTARVKAGGFVGNFVNKGTCDHCGAWFQYGAEYKHDDGETIVVGHTCADHDFSYPSRAARDKGVAIKLVRGRKLRMAAIEAAQAFIAEHDLAGVFSAAHMDDDSKAGRTLADMYDRILKWGSISEKALGYARSLSTRLDTPDTCDFCGGAHGIFACDRKGHHPMHGERLTFKARIIYTKWETGFNGDENLVMGIFTEDGWSAQGTVPAALRSSVDNYKELRGSTIEVTARLKAHKGGDRTRCYLNRPFAKLIEASEFVANPKTLPTPTDAELREAIKASR